MKTDTTIKGRKQKSFSISVRLSVAQVSLNIQKFGHEGAWLRANRCKEFIEKFRRFPIDENELESAFQQRSSRSSPAKENASIWNTPGTKRSMSRRRLLLPCPLTSEDYTPKQNILNRLDSREFQRIVPFLTASDLGTVERCCRRLRNLVEVSDGWRIFFKIQCPHILPSADANIKIVAAAEKATRFWLLWNDDLDNAELAKTVGKCTQSLLTIQKNFSIRLP